MWTRIWFLLVAIRLYFTFSASYIHPDENFQGPEVIAGRVFGFDHHLTWEFDSDSPARSVFPLWVVYGVPANVLYWLHSEIFGSRPSPRFIYYFFRLVMFLLSFIFEDWAIHELIQSPRQRRLAITLMASSYVTWTYQTHTFSNSIETIVVLWTLVLVEKIKSNKNRSSILASFAIGFLLVFGVFNRITFPAFVIGPVATLIPHFARKPLTFIAMMLSCFFTLSFAVLTDTSFYTPSLTFKEHMRAVFLQPVLTPLNSLLYNISPANLATHGLHPRFTHVLGNLPLLLGPALLLFVLRPRYSPLLITIATSLLGLSVIPHQEPRFIIPLVPLILSSIHLPTSSKSRKFFIGTWIVFNALMAVLMGLYHQGGVIPMQNHLHDIKHSLPHEVTVLWWKTYSPPLWLFDASTAASRPVDLMGMSGPQVLDLARGATIRNASTSIFSRAPPEKESIVLVTPDSNLFLDTWKECSFHPASRLAQRTLHPEQICAKYPGTAYAWQWERLYTIRTHVGLDDLDFGDDGVWPTIERVVGRRGLTAWNVTGGCVKV